MMSMILIEMLTIQGLTWNFNFISYSGRCLILPDFFMNINMTRYGILSIFTKNKKSISALDVTQDDKNKKQILLFFQYY